MVEGVDIDYAWLLERLVDDYWVSIVGDFLRGIMIQSFFFGELTIERGKDAQILAFPWQSESAESDQI